MDGRTHGFCVAGETAHGILAPMSPRPLLLVALILAGCAGDFDALKQKGDGYPLTSTGESTGVVSTTSGDDAVTTTTMTGVGGTTGLGETSADATSTGASDGSGGLGETSSGSSGEPVLPPEILAIDVPAEVSVAGPVSFTATTEHATSARAKLDGVDLGVLVDEGGGVFSGVLAIYGTVDNGDHVLEVIAENGELLAQDSAKFTVGTPAPGTAAWTMSGPTGSRTRRITVTPEGDVLEVGTLTIVGVPRPVIRKRSGVTGAELWPAGTIVLDDREGEAVGVAVAPDGRLWVAMNVREAPNKWRPRIVLLDSWGHWEGVEVPSAAGQTVRGIDNDGTGGCFAVGFVGTGYGDTDVAVWRMTGELVPVLSGKTWDYVPPDQLAHTFTDVAADVVVRDGVAWIVGFSRGKYEDPKNLRSRGLVVRMDVDTASVVDPTLIAPTSGIWTQSVFFGAAAHPDGVLVTGNGCNNTCDMQRVETALYTGVGTRSWFRPEKSSTVAYGNSVALSTHGLVVVAATIREGTALRGHLLGRSIVNEAAETFTSSLPPSQEPSEATGAAIGPYDRVYGGGYRTFGGVPEAWAIHLHP